MKFIYPLDLPLKEEYPLLFLSCPLSEIASASTIATVITGIIPLTPVSMNMFLFEFMEKNSTHYTIGMLWYSSICTVDLG